MHFELIGRIQNFILVLLEHKKISDNLFNFINQVKMCDKPEERKRKYREIVASRRALESLEAKEIRLT